MKKFLENQYVYFIVVTIGTFFVIYTIFYFIGFAPKSFYVNQDIPTLSLNDEIKKSLKIDTDTEEVLAEEAINQEQNTNSNNSGNPNTPVSNNNQVRPNPNPTPSPNTNTAPSPTQNSNFTTPDKISISKIGVSSNIQKPTNPTVANLDLALTRGAVYYPGSGYIEQGNILLFGHSTNWQVVQNQAYKTFNNLDKLVNGDEIILEANNKKYIYKVNKVYLADENNAEIFFDKTKRTLTVSTCNTFGKKQERWIAVAEFYKEV